MQKTVVNQPVVGENKSSRSGVSSTEAALTKRAAKDSERMADSDSTPGRAPAFQFYPKDFLTDENVRVMSLQERGAYITLLCSCWTEGSLPSDVNRLAKLCGTHVAAFRKLWPALDVCFRAADDEPGRLVHPRLERERDKQAEFKRRQSDNGKKGGRPVKPNESRNNPSLSSGLTQTKPKESSSSLSSSSSSSSDSSQERKERVPTRAHYGPGAGAGSNPRDHLNCRGDGRKCERVCVSERQHAVLRQRYGGTPEAADAALDAFYAEVRSSLDPDIPIGDTPWKFWESQFSARFGTIAVHNPKTAGNAAAVTQWLAGRRA